MTDKENSKLIKEWAALTQRQAVLDQDVNAYARRLRDIFPKNANVDRGDIEFRAWCAEHLGVNEFKAKELLTRALAALVFAKTDTAALSLVTGVRGDRPSNAYFDLCALSRPRQAEIMQKARDQNKTIATVKRELEAADGVRETVKIKPAIDAKMFAQYIQQNVRNISPPVRLAMARYIKLAQERAEA